MNSRVFPGIGVTVYRYLNQLRSGERRWPLLADNCASAQKTFPASDALFNQECSVGTPTWIPRGLNICVAFEADAVWTLNWDQSGRLILSCHDKGRNLQRTLDITDPMREGQDPNGGNGIWNMAAMAQGVAVTTDNRLVVTQPDGKLVSLTLPHQAERLCPTLPHTRQGVAVMLKHGAVMHWRGAQELIELDRDIESARAAFVPGGPLVLISGSQGILLEVDARGVHGVTRFELLPRIQSASAPPPIPANSPSSMPKAKWLSIRSPDNSSSSSSSSSIISFEQAFRSITLADSPKERPKHRWYFPCHATRARSALSRPPTQLVRTLCRAKHFFDQLPLTRAFVLPQPRTSRFDLFLAGSACGGLV